MKVSRTESVQRQEVEGTGAELGDCRAERAPCLLIPYLRVAQCWVGSLNSRHSQRETLQPPQQMAKVIIATHCHCQGFLSCARGLWVEKTGGWTLQNPSTTWNSTLVQAAVEPALLLLAT